MLSRVCDKADDELVLESGVFEELRTVVKDEVDAGQLL
jgi:hypothetical protein